MKMMRKRPNSDKISMKRIILLFYWIYGKYNTHKAFHIG
jgi:hypothetical protein